MIDIFFTTKKESFLDIAINTEDVCNYLKCKHDIQVNSNELSSMITRFNNVSYCQFIDMIINHSKEEIIKYLKRIGIVFPVG